MSARGAEWEGAGVEGELRSHRHRPGVVLGWKSNGWREGGREEGSGRGTRIKYYVGFWVVLYIIYFFFCMTCEGTVEVGSFSHCAPSRPTGS